MADVTNSSRAAAVVGAGIAGLFAARYLQSKGWRVSVVETETEAGGLFRSADFGEGRIFDCGIHYAIETGMPAIDAMLFEAIDSSEWHVFEDSLPAGHVFGGELYEDSDCIDARRLPEAVFLKGFYELLSAPGAAGDEANLAEELTRTYGPTFADAIYRPVMAKLTGQTLERLAPGAHKAFHLSRLIVLPSAAATEIKRSPAYDSVIAFARTRDGRSAIRKLYPKSGGVGSWPQALVRRIEADGGSMHFGRSVSRLEMDGSAPRRLVLDDGTPLVFDVLVWTAPAAILAQLIGRPAGVRPQHRHLWLGHFIYDQPALVRNHWVTVHDERYKSYRVTIYDNIAPCASRNPGRITVECLVDTLDSGDDRLGAIDTELRAMGIVPQRAETKWRRSAGVPRAFPVPQAVPPDARAAQAEPLELANVIVAGRAAAKEPSQTAVLRHAYAALEAARL